MVTHSSMAYADKNGTIRTNVTTFLHTEGNQVAIVSGSSFNLSVADAKDLIAELSKAIYDAETRFDNA